MHSRQLRCATIVIALLTSSMNFADGPRDNVPTNVRRVPRLGIEVPVAKADELAAGLERLKERLTQIANAEDESTRQRVPDVEIFYRAVSDALEFQEFFKDREIDDAMQHLQRAEARVERILDGKGDLSTIDAPESGLAVRGYRSKIDDSVQPYGLVLPKDYSPQKRYRLDVWFHGRGETMSENVFLTQRLKNKGVFAPADTIVLHPYGRYSNAFKFAGEVDVLEAIEHVKANYNIDDNRISVRGFSMGGAACWQFAVHYADRWFAANPGAGFSETPEFLKFFQKETLNPTWYEEKLWQMYDCNLWARNLMHCPTVAYSGEVDIQKQAADIMATALDELNVDLVHVIGPQTGHKYHPDSAAEVALRMDGLAVRGRDYLPREIDFVTYTLKYNRMHWMTVDALEEHWERAWVSARIESAEPTIHILAQNVAQLSVEIPSGAWPHRMDLPVKVFINGKGGDVVQAKSDRSLRLTLTKRGDVWDAGDRETAGLAKKHGLQGPIDDAFMDSFIFVRPTGKANNALVGDWAEAELDRAIEHWRRHFRGYARVKNDTDITEEDIASSNLILWGDPGSNRLIGRVAKDLPVRWTPDSVEVNSEKYDAGHHGLIAIYPNPLNPARYVVLNSSFTYREFAYLNNARQVPKLPDWAVIDVQTPPDSLWPGKVVDANFFDESWQLKPTSD